MAEKMDAHIAHIAREEVKQMGNSRHQMGEAPAPEGLLHTHGILKPRTTRAGADRITQGGNRGTIEALPTSMKEGSSH